MDPNTTIPSTWRSRDSRQQALVVRRWWPGLLVLAAVGLAAYWALAPAAKGDVPTGAGTGRPAAPAVPVVVATARRGDMPIYLSGLGSVTAFNTVTVRSRVDGQLMRVAFEEGQLVQEGDLLAEIDPRPFEVQLTQAEGQLAKDAAQLKAAIANLTRNRELLAKQLIAKQLVDDQAATVGQYEGALKADQGLVDNAKLQLTYARITAPIGGRVGLRLVDAGNMVHASDPNGLVVITQLQPIAVVFTLPEDDLPPVLAKLQHGDTLSADAYDRAGQTRIATGRLLTVDNQIDRSTGTSRLKALFENEDGALFPNQFVNVRLMLDVRRDAVIVPAAAVQRGPQGTFVFVVKPDKTIEVRPVTVGAVSSTDDTIETGLSQDEIVVVDGVDKLRPGVAVQVRAPSTPGPARAPSA